MSKARVRRRLLAHRRADKRWVLKFRGRRPVISTALHRLACRVPIRRQWWP